MEPEWAFLAQCISISAVPSRDRSPPGAAHARRCTGDQPQHIPPGRACGRVRRCEQRHTRNGEGVQCGERANPSAFDAGRPSLLWSPAACGKLLKNLVPGGSMPAGAAAGAAKNGVVTKNEGQRKRPGTTWLPGLLSIKRSGGRTLWDYCPALQPPPGDGAVSSKPLPSHCGWLERELPSMQLSIWLSMWLWPCKYAAAPWCEGSRLDIKPMDDTCALNAPRTATAHCGVRRWMALWRAFMAVSRRWSACSCGKGTGTWSPDDRGL
jgi:hypothetical protein